MPEAALAQVQAEWLAFVNTAEGQYRTNQGPKTDNPGGSTHCTGPQKLRDMWQKPVRIETGLKKKLHKDSSVSEDANPVVDWMGAATENSSAAKLQQYQSHLKSIVDATIPQAETVQPSFITGAIQPGGCITHFDKYDNVAMLVQGSKVFYITEHKNIVERPGGDNEQPDVSSPVHD